VRDTSAPPAQPIIALENVEKYYGEYHALRGITAEIRQGEFFSLLGPSGCGKTTLLRAIAGFEDISSGRILLDGRDMEGVAPNKRPTNLVFQSYAIFPHLTVAQNVGFGLRKSPQSAEEKRRAVGEALEMVGLANFGGRAAHALSGGQRQRVALARALILKPRVLLLDEPLSALDKKMREVMQVELIKLQREVGITFILVTHDQEEALVMSDRIAVMFEGSIAQLDDPETLYRRPSSRRVAEFIGMMNFLPASVISSQGDAVEAEIAGLGRAELSTKQCPSGAAPGDAAVGLRPESLTILFEGDNAGGARRAEGRVEEVTYYGDMTYYDMALEGAPSTVRVSARNMPGRRVLDRGETTALAWDPRALTLFR
jgi:spermidine/putrescine transport system ATP-binding protein